MLKKKYRLNFTTHFKNLSVVNTKFCAIRFRENGLLFNKYGFVVSKKLDKRATVRNRAKRKVRSCIEINLEKIKAGHDFIFFLKKDVVLAETKDICESIISAFKKEELI